LPKRRLPSQFHATVRYHALYAQGRPLHLVLCLAYLIITPLNKRRLELQLPLGIRIGYNGLEKGWGRGWLDQAFPFCQRREQRPVLMLEGDVTVCLYVYRRGIAVRCATSRSVYDGCVDASFNAEKALAD
jgi:hypothetical protein